MGAFYLNHEDEMSRELTGLPMDQAPRNGDMVWLLIDYSPATNAADIEKMEAEGYLWDAHPLADADRAWTIGFNNLENTDEDRWQFAGWCWSQDHFTEGRGTPVAWKPIGFDLEDDGEAEGQRAKRFEQMLYELEDCGRKLSHLRSISAARPATGLAKAEADYAAKRSALILSALGYAELVGQPAL